MATCTVIRKDPTPPPPAEVVLTLSEDEAKCLQVILGGVGGDPGGPRGFVDAMLHVLDNKLGCYPHEKQGLLQPHARSIYFAPGAKL